MTIRRSGAILMMVLLFPGCGFFSRPKNQFYSLDTIPVQAPARAIVGGVPVGLDGIELPPGFDRRGIVLRGPDHKFEVRGTHQWASSLEEMVIHTLAFDLASRLPEGMVILPGHAKPAAMRSLFVTFEDLAPGPDNVFVLDARWSITETGAQELTKHERITIPLTSMESPAIAAAMSQALAALAERIVAAM
jgi:uncharacterized lipoprotein YmbA